MSSDDSQPILDEMTEEVRLTIMAMRKAPWYVDIANYLACEVFLEFEFRAMRKAFFWESW